MPEHPLSGIATEICSKLRSHHNVFVLGPPKVGRSTLLQLLGDLEKDDFYEYVSFEKLTFLAPSSGQNLEIIPDLEVMIYMIDASEIEPAMVVFDKLSKLSRRGVHFSILCNKQDLCSVDKASNIAKDYVITPFLRKKRTFHMCSLKTGDAGIAAVEAALEFLSKRIVQLEEAERATSIVPAASIVSITPPISGFPLAGAVLNFCVNLTLPHSVAVLGTKSAGRTTLLSLLGCTKRVRDTETVCFDKVTFFAPDSWESPKLAKQHPDIKGILYITDYSSRDAFREASKDLSEICFCLDLREVFVGVLANKSDLERAWESLEIPDFFEDRFVQRTCSLLSHDGTADISDTLNRLGEFIHTAETSPSPVESLTIDCRSVLCRPNGLFRFDRPYNVHDYPRARFLGVDIFRQRGRIDDESIILSRDDFGRSAIMKNCAPGGDIRWGPLQKRLTVHADVSPCLKFYGGFRDFPLGNTCLFSHILWGPSHGRCIDGVRFTPNAPSLDEDISQVHTLILGIMSGTGAVFEIEEIERIKYYDMPLFLKPSDFDPDLNSRINYRCSVHGNPYEILRHEYSKHGRRGYFTIENYVRLLLYINDTYCLENLLRKIHRFPSVEIGCVEVSLSDLQKELEAVIGAAVQVDVLCNKGDYYLSGIEIMFYINGVEMNHLKSDVVRGLGSEKPDVKVLIENLAWRREWMMNNPRG